MRKCKFSSLPAECPRDLQHGNYEQLENSEKHAPLNFIPMKSQELLVEERWEGL